MGNSNSVVKENSATNVHSKCEPVKRGYGTSVVRKERFIYTWTLKELKSLGALLQSSTLPPCQIASHPFKAGESVEKPCEWYLILVPEESNQDRYLSLQLVLSKYYGSETKAQVPVEFSVNISIGQGQNIKPFIQNQKEIGLVVFEKKPGKDHHGWKNLLKNNEAVTNILEAGKVVIECDMEIWGNKKPDLESDFSLGFLIPNKKPRYNNGNNSNADVHSELANKLLSLLYSQYKTGKMTDVKIETGSGILTAHKIVLRAHSSYFENLFQDENSDLIQMHDCNEKTLKVVLEWMYSGNLDRNIDFDTHSKLLKLTDKLNLNPLKIHIFTWMTEKVEENSLTSKNLSEVIILASKYTLKESEGEIFQRLKEAFSSEPVTEKLTSSSNFKDLLSNYPDACASFWF